MLNSKWMDGIRAETRRLKSVVDKDISSSNGEIFKIFSSEKNPSYGLLRKYINTKIPLIILVGFLSVLATVLEASSLLLLILLLAILVGESSHIEKGIDILGFHVPLPFLSDLANAENAFTVVLLIAVTFKLANECVHFLSSHFVSKAQVDVSYEIRSDLFQKMLGLNLSFFSDQKPGEMLYMEGTLINRLTNFLPMVQTLFSSALNLVALTVIMLMLSPMMTVLLGALGLGFLMLVGRMEERTKVQSMDLEKSGQNATQYFLETMYGIRLIKQAEKVLQARNKYQDLAWDRERRTLKLLDYLAFNKSLVEFGGLVILLLAALGAKVLSGVYILSKIGLGLGYLYIALRAVKTVAGLQAQRMRLAVLIPQFKIIADFLLDQSYMEESSVKVQRTPLSTIERSISIESLSFGYNSEKSVLNDVTLQFAAGTSTAIVGLSGSGKTTLVELMAGFRTGYNGQILADGVNVGSHNLDSYRNQIGYVTQETIVLHDTLLSNINFFKPDASMEAVENVAKISRISDFIDDTEAGYETVMGERGFKVSGGQRQRIALARVLLQDPKVLILDEATSAVDLYTEAHILNNLHKLTSDKIVVVVAHRLSSIAQFDNIVVVHKGKVIEQGTHVELLALRGLYHTLVSLQEFAPDINLDTLSENIINS